MAGLTATASDAAAQPRPHIAALKRYVDVSPPWLNRVIERRPR